MKTKSGIYQIVNLVNRKRYIGSAVSLRSRRYQHFRLLKEKKHYNRHLQSSYNKYGKENFKFEILLYCSKEDLIFYEQRAINASDFNKELYNICPKAGSIAGTKQSEETIKKRSFSLKNHPRKEESRKKRNETMAGFRHSKESIEKMKKSHQGHIVSEETKLKMSLIMTGKKKSKKHSINIGKAKRKEKHPSYIAFTKEEMKKIKKMRREGATYQQISKKFGCVHSTIGLRFKEINKNKNKNKIKISERDRISFSSEELKLMIDLRKEGKSYAKITKYFNNCSKTVIMNRLKKLIN